MADVQCEDLYVLIEEGCFAGHAPLQDQMDRSSASVMDNIAEGFDRFTKADFRHFLVIARGSNAEFRSQLYRAVKRSVIDQLTFERLKKESEHLGVKLHHLIAYLTRTDFKQKPDDRKLSDRPNDIREPQTDYNLLPAYNLPDEFIVVNPN